jgi:hypothetical protein
MSKKHTPAPDAESPTAKITWRKLKASALATALPKIFNLHLSVMDNLRLDPFRTEIIRLDEVYNHQVDLIRKALNAELPEIDPPKPPAERTPEILQAIAARKTERDIKFDEEINKLLDQPAGLVLKAPLPWISAANLDRAQRAEEKRYAEKGAFARDQRGRVILENLLLSTNELSELIAILNIRVEETAGKPAPAPAPAPDPQP